MTKTNGKEGTKKKVFVCGGRVSYKPGKMILTGPLHIVNKFWSNVYPNFINDFSIKHVKPTNVQHPDSHKIVLTMTKQAKKIPIADWKKKLSV